MKKIGRPKLPEDKKRKSIHIKLDPKVFKAINFTGKNKTWLIETAIKKYLKMK